MPWLYLVGLHFTVEYLHLKTQGRRYAPESNDLELFLFFFLGFPVGKKATDKVSSKNFNSK